VEKGCVVAKEKERENHHPRHQETFQRRCGGWGSGGSRRHGLIVVALAGTRMIVGLQMARPVSGVRHVEGGEK